MEKKKLILQVSHKVDNTDSQSVRMSSWDSYVLNVTVNASASTVKTDSEMKSERPHLFCTAIPVLPSKE